MSSMGKAVSKPRKTEKKQDEQNLISMVVELLGCDPPVWEQLFVPLADIRTLKQVRKSVNRIASLAETLITAGSINPVTLFIVDEAQARGYIDLNNGLHAGSLTLRDVRAASDGLHYILIAGHRRLEANQYLWENGCKKCRKQYGREKPGACYERHFHRDSLEVRASRNISALLATCIQHIENIHVQVPPTQDAPATAALYNVLQQVSGKITVGKLATLLGKSSHQVGDALRFQRLPEKFRKSANRGDISWGIALEFETILRETKKNPKIVQSFPEGYEKWLEDEWLKKAALGDGPKKYTPDKLRKLINSETQMRIYGQCGLDLEGETVRSSMRSLIIDASRGLMIGGCDYLQRVLRLFGDGVLEEHECPFRDPNFRRDMTKMIDLLRAMVPHLKWLAEHDRKRVKELATVVSELIQEIDQLDDKLAGVK